MPDNPVSEPFDGESEWPTDQIDTAWLDNPQVRHARHP